MTNKYHSELTLYGKNSELVSFCEWLEKNSQPFVNRFEEVGIRKLIKKKVTLSLRTNWDVISGLLSVAPRLYPHFVFVLRSISFDDYIEKLLIKKNIFVYFDLELPIISELFPEDSSNLSSLFSFNVSWIYKQVFKIAKSEIVY